MEKKKNSGSSGFEISEVIEFLKWSSFGIFKLARCPWSVSEMVIQGYKVSLTWSSFKQSIF